MNAKVPRITEPLLDEIARKIIDHFNPDKIVLFGSHAHGARKGIDQGDLSCVKAISDDIRACGLFLLHLAYRFPQWLGENFFSGLDAIRIELERIGEDMASVFREESTKLIQNSELVLVFSQVDAPTFVLGDCGPFLSRDTELGVDNQKQKRDDPN